MLSASRFPNGKLAASPTKDFAKIARAITFSRAAISRPSSTGARRRSTARRSHRHRHLVDLRRASALRSAAEWSRISVADDKEAAHQIDHLRAALVFARRHE